MSEKKFKVGDIVVLKSGSQRMMVSRFTEVEGNTYCHCDWSDGKQSLSEDYPEAVLEYAEEAEQREKRQNEKFKEGLL